MYMIRAKGQKNLDIRDGEHIYLSSGLMTRDGKHHKWNIFMFISTVQDVQKNLSAISFVLKRFLHYNDEGGYFHEDTFKKPLQFKDDGYPSGYVRLDNCNTGPIVDMFMLADQDYRREIYMDDDFIDEDRDEEVREAEFLKWDRINRHRNEYKYGQYEPALPYFIKYGGKRDVSVDRLDTSFDYGGQGMTIDFDNAEPVSDSQSWQQWLSEFMECNSSFKHSTTSKKKKKKNEKKTTKKPKKKTPKKKTPKKKGGKVEPCPGPNWSKCTVEMLKQALRDKDMKVSGKKKDLIERLEDADKSSPPKKAKKKKTKKKTEKKTNKNKKKTK